VAGNSTNGQPHEQEASSVFRPAGTPPMLPFFTRGSHLCESALVLYLLSYEGFPTKHDILKGLPSKRRITTTPSHTQLSGRRGFGSTHKENSERKIGCPALRHSSSSSCIRRTMSSMGLIVSIELQFIAQKRFAPEVIMILYIPFTTPARCRDSEGAIHGTMQALFAQHLQPL
jgi:hypothetical protein